MEFSSIKKNDWIISPMNTIIIDVRFNTFSTTEVYTMKAVEKLEQLQNQFGVWTEADPAVMEAFGGMVQASFENCAPLDAVTLELLIVAVAVARKCEPCIYSHVNSYIDAGGTREALVAGLNAALLICGGPGMAYSALALDIFDQLKEAKEQQ
jgi:4-carboxymuconolactone decarboxylase